MRYTLKLKINQPILDIVVLLVRLSLILTAIFLLANWTWVILLPYSEPIPPTISSSRNEQLNTIKYSHWFSADQNDAQPVNLNFKLIGVFLTDDKTTGFAVIKTPDNKQFPVLIHQEIYPGLVLQNLGSDFIEVGQPGHVKKITIESK